MKKLLTLFALLLTAFALVACGGGDSDTTSGQTGAATTEETTEAEGGGESATLDFEADPGGDLAFTEDEVTAEAGKVTVNLTNPAPVPHDVVIENAEGKEIARTDVITESNDSTTASLKAGDYTFYCSVPGHRQSGMEGDLTVE